MKRRYQRLLAILCALMLSFALSTASIADAGNFGGDSDWGGGGSDWGGGGGFDWSGGSDWGGSSGWGSSSGGGGVFFLDGGSFSGGGCTGGANSVLIIVSVVIVAIIIIRFARSKKETNAQTLYQAAEDNDPGLSLSILKEKDPAFNEQAFLEKVGNDYVRMQNAWESGDWTPMRAIMTDSLYQQMARQLDELKQANLTNHVERIAILDARIRRYAQEGDNDVLVVRLSTRICDYTTNDKTGELVRGNKTKELFMTYDWKLIRQKDQTTEEQASMSAVSCPNCSAPLEINHTGKCPYCGTVITLSEHDWALSVIKGISQRSN